MELYNEDCLERMKDISNNSIDLLFCDLPYGQTGCAWDCLIDLELFWKEVNRICKITCPMFFTCSTKFGVSLINSNPKNFRYDLVWVKSASCGFLTAKKMPMKKHEMVYVFYRKLPLYDISSHRQKFLKTEKNPKEADAVYANRYVGATINKYDPPLPNSVITTELPTKNKILPVPQLVGCEGKVVRKKQEKYDPILPNSILEIKSEKGHHPTQKPVDLIMHFLKYYSKEGDTVLDPTMGSGSTGIACKNLNRKFIGIELNKDIFETAKKRLNNE